MKKSVGSNVGRRRWDWTAIIAAAVLCLLAGTIAVGPGIFSSTVTVPTGTMLTVRVARPLDSRSVHLGDAFDAQVVSTKTTDGEPLLPPGAWVEGRCVAVRPGDSEGRPGYLRLALSGLRDLQGNLAPLETTTFSQWGNGPLEIAGDSGNNSAWAVAPGREAGSAWTRTAHSSEAVVPPEAPLTFTLLKPAEIKGDRSAVGTLKRRI